MRKRVASLALLALAAVTPAQAEEQTLAPPFSHRETTRSDCGSPYGLQQAEALASTCTFTAEAELPGSIETAVRIRSPQDGTLPGGGSAEVISSLVAEHLVSNAAAVVYTVRLRVEEAFSTRAPTRLPFVTTGSPNTMFSIRAAEADDIWGTSVGTNEWVAIENTERTGEFVRRITLARQGETLDGLLALTVSLNSWASLGSTDAGEVATGGRLTVLEVLANVIPAN